MTKARKKASHPWVAAATLCENILEDKDNVMSIIRMVDLFNVPRPPEWDGKENLQLLLNGLLAFKSGDVKGKRIVRIYGVSPKGKRQKLHELSMDFLGGNTGVNLKLRMVFGFKTEGTHWLDVYVEKRLTTRIPITILFHELVQPVAPAEK